MKPLTSSYISRHQYFTARKDSYETENGKLVDPYFVVELPVSACAMAVTKNNEVIFVEQYRHPIGQKILELPGGFVEEGEDPALGVARELLEETGYAFKEFVQLGTTAANPGVLNNFTYLFLATGGVKQSEQALDHNEEIEIVLKPLEEARQLLKENKIVQSMHALCMFYAFEKMKER
ncbi:MAG: NUDIX hydrolase [Ferruginibacter sp.]